MSKLIIGNIKKNKCHCSPCTFNFFWSKYRDAPATPTTKAAITTKLYSITVHRSTAPN